MSEPIATSRSKRALRSAGADRALAILLQAALALSIVAAILFAVRIIMQQAVNVGTWYWGGAVAVFAAPLLLAAALKLVTEQADA